MGQYTEAGQIHRQWDATHCDNRLSVILSLATVQKLQYLVPWMISQLVGFIRGLAELSLNHFKAEARYSQIERCLIPPRPSGLIQKLTAALDTLCNT